MKIPAVLLLLFTACGSGRASAAAPAQLAFDTYTGYFVSNKFEPDAAASFVVVRDPERFDEVFRPAFVMRDKSHRLPKDAFQSLLVVAAIKRGNALVEYKVEGVSEAKGVVELRYTTAETKRGSATFACPLIVSIPKGKYAAVRFIENGAAVKVLPLSYSTLGSIERFDPRFDQLVPRDAVLEKLAEGFKWTEGPVWIGHARDSAGGPAPGSPDGGLSGNYLLFSDIPNNAVMKWKDGDGISVFLKPSGYTGTVPRGGEQGSNALTLDSAGRLVLCQHGDRRIARHESDGRWTTLADRYAGKRFNSPNDLVFKSNGDLYFTDPPYGLPKGAEDPTRELDFCGVFRLSAADGKVTLLTGEMTRPNGIAFSPDEKILYVSQSDPQKAVWMAFPVKDDGTLGPGRVFYDATRWTRTLKGLPDGMKIDRQGNLFATGPGGVNVFSPDGTLLGRINPDQPTSNCTFGENGSVLYVTANQYLCRIKLSRSK
jgi:gluconolactonase